MEKTISQKITGLRKAAGLTQEQLGEKLGISGQAVSKWERGEAMPDILLLPDLCDVLGTTLDSLLGGKRAENPRAIDDFCMYAMKNGRAETVRQAFADDAVFDLPASAPQNIEQLEKRLAVAVNSAVVEVYFQLIRQEIFVAGKRHGGLGVFARIAKISEFIYKQ